MSMLECLFPSFGGLGFLAFTLKGLVLIWRGPSLIVVGLPVRRMSR